MEQSLADLAPVRELYSKGMYLDAWQKVQELGPVENWTHPGARLLLGRLVLQLGAPRWGHWLHLQAFRDNPTYHEAIYYHARYRYEKFGPLSAWRFMRRHAEWYDASPTVRADWVGLQAFIAGRFRDFDRAERLINKAEAIAPDRPWLSIERASVYEFAERWDDALAAARRAQELVPFFRPGVQAEAHILFQQGKEEAALQILTEADAHTQSSLITVHKAGVLFELGRIAEAKATYERYESLAPLMEPDTRKWLHARFCDVSYALGDFAAARTHAPQAIVDDEPFYADFARTLQETNASQPATVRLDPPRLIEFWKVHRPDASAVEILANAYITTVGKKYEPGPSPAVDGLSNPQERLWLEAQGLTVHEGRLDDTIAYTLVEAGLPFILTLTDAGYSHSFLIVGGDRLRQTAWMIDPVENKINEAPLRPLLERYEGTGPRILVAHPAGQNCPELPDQQAYQTLFDLQKAIRQETRDGTNGIRELHRKMKGEGIAPRLQKLADLLVARFDAQPTRTLEAIQGLSDLYPKDANFMLGRMQALRELGRREERQAIARQQTDLYDGDPIFAQYHAQTALADFRLYREGVIGLRRAIRERPQNASAYFLLASLLWDSDDREEAADMYRVAASLDDREDQYAEAYLRAAKILEQQPEAMRFLKTRHQRLLGQSHAAAKGYIEALLVEQQREAALQVVEETLAVFENRTRKDSEDKEYGRFLLYTVPLLRWLKPSEDVAGKHLEQARQLLDPLSYHKAVAPLHLQLHDITAAEASYEAALAIEPRDVDTIRALGRLKTDRFGREAALEWIRNRLTSFPGFYPLQQLLVEWRRNDTIPVGGSAEPLPAENILEVMLAECPEDAWCRRELALHLASRGRTREALEQLEIARRAEPNSPSYYYSLGHVYSRADRTDDAKDAYSEVIRQTLDNDLAIGELLNLARGDEEKKEVLEFLAEEVKKQPIVGDGLFAYRDQALQILEPDDVLRVVQPVLDEKPEIWQAWSVAIQLLALTGRMEEARELAKGATENFPLTSRLWLDLAETHESSEDGEIAMQALQKAFEMSPGWSFASRAYAENLEEEERFEEARHILEWTVFQNPSDAVNMGYLADFLWNRGDTEAAYRCATDALLIDPGYEWAWRSLSDWAERLEKPEAAIETAREIASHRPGDFRVWLALARLLTGSEHNAEVLESLDRALQLYPRCVEAYDMKAERLAEMRQFDEAKAAATPSIFDPEPPMVLQGRAAWVESRRGNLPVAIREMSALVTLEPNYYWGWQQLAEWYNETNQPEEFLEATRKLVELRPESPVALAMRGEAKMQCQDRDGGKEDLREAQKNAPSYSYAGMLLFDAHVQDQEYDAALPVLSLLQEHVGGPGMPFVVARQAQLAARREDKPGAEQALRDVLQLPCDSSWPVSMSISELRNAGWSESVDSILGQTITEAEYFHPMALSAWLDSPSGQEANPEEKLQKIDRAIQIHPEHFQPYDIKAELLTRLNRFEEALQSCMPSQFGDNPPVALRGRAAWVTASKGDYDDAIATMRSILEEDPDYYWGWQQLSIWYDTTGNYPEYLQAAEQMIRLDPTNPASHAYRGEARLHQGDRRGAKTDFQKAFDLDPGNAFAGLHLIDEQIYDNEFNAAKGTLAKLQEHNDGPYIQLRAIRLAAKQKNQEECQELFTRLVSDGDTPSPVLNKSMEALELAGFSSPLDNWLDDLIDSPEATPLVGRLWVERKVKRNERDYLAKLDELMIRGEIGQEAVLAAVEACDKPTQKEQLLNLIQKYRPTLERSSRNWAKVALAFEAVGDYKEGYKWISDWDNRTVDSPWMLHPPTLILRSLGKYSEAIEVTQKALKVEADDGSVPDFRVWFSFEYALKGEPDEADDCLDGVDVNSLSEATRILYGLTRQLIIVQQAGPVRRRQIISQVQTEVGKLLASYKPEGPNPDLAACYQRFVKRLSDDVGGLGMFIWRMKQKFRPPV